MRRSRELAPFQILIEHSPVCDRRRCLFGCYFLVVMLGVLLGLDGPGQASTPTPLATLAQTGYIWVEGPVAARAAEGTRGGVRAETGLRAGRAPDLHRPEHRAARLEPGALLGPRGGHLRRSGRPRWRLGLACC